MSELPSNLKRQKLAGYVLLAGAVTILIGSIAVFQYYDLPPISYLGPLVPVGILVAFGYRAVSASNDQKALGDERTAELFGKVSINAFWWLMAIILINGSSNLVPRDSAEFLYLGSGLAIFAIYYVYYRYIE
ncbi:hypothetical protein [Natrialba aegyptia]|uniref:DUF2178 domain-containing protein n=1 Tax=Natrialba aegyptia DSM 13077 TaxID=1227491 RepID=M0AXQ5_9EURY|nr:hypothetical protein [Natrialba aegyptia]ELZ02199.1 hypothetical protein C480_17752 [Natrialba aegyptia DSM 13077]